MLKSVSAFSLPSRVCFWWEGLRRMSVVADQVDSQQSERRGVKHGRDNAEDEDDPASKVRRKRRKYAILLSYSGLGYYGLQRNPGTKTIEDDFLVALHKVGLISDEGVKQPQLFQFQRAARTDKGVSAIGQVLSARLPEDVDPEEVNKLLPEQIRLMGVKRVTKGFNCKMSCDARTYSYTMPSFALASPAMLGLKVTNESDRVDTKVVEGEIGTTVSDHHSSDANSKSNEVQSIPSESFADNADSGASNIVSSSNTASAELPMGGCGVSSSSNGTSTSTPLPTPGDNCQKRSGRHNINEDDDAVDDECEDEDALAAANETPYDEESLEKMYSFRASQDLIDATNKTLSLFIGTHNYHNFTSRRKPMDPSCQRYIMDFTCSNPILYGDMEFVTIKIKGQSFMLHQIRKMVGLTIAIIRGHTGEETLAKAWDKDRIDIPIAPGLGLVLEQVHYDRYNKRYGGDGVHEPVDWSYLSKELNDFKTKFIMSTILETEKAQHSMSSWLKKLDHHTLDVRESGPPNPPANGTCAGDS